MGPLGGTGMEGTMNQIDTMSVNAIRVLAADAVQKAKSGHPGLPLGAAAMSFELWAKHMNHNPKNPGWENRDRFILSGGHGSTLLYSLLHLFGYGLTKEDMMNFRQMDSLTPGHPEYGHTVGVEATTGPLGAGMGMAVGMAMAESHLAAVFNKDGYPVVDHYTYVLGGDGCMMEGISSEAFSLAGTMGLGKLIVFYDSNNISIEGSTDIAFTEDVTKRFEAFGFQTLEVKDGNNLAEIAAAIEAAKADTTRPTMIKVNTVIGYGCPAKQGKASAHGEPLGEENVAALKEYLEWPCKEAFTVPQEVYDHFNEAAKKKAAVEDEWNVLFEKYRKEYPDMAEKWDAYYNGYDLSKLFDSEDYWKKAEKPEATRSTSGSILNEIKQLMPNLIGGSADLAPSNKTNMKDAGDFSKDNYAGTNLHFGVREQAMAAIGNGLALHGGLKAFVATFFVFSDYTKPMARLSALMNLPLTFIFTHDSIGVGEDGPTHEPVEQEVQIRLMEKLKNHKGHNSMLVLRPADVTETTIAWKMAMENTATPTALIFSRQNITDLPAKGNRYDEALQAEKGAYIVESDENPDVIMVASGSEVSTLEEGAALLRADGIKVRIVSVPSEGLFRSQSKEYQESVIPTGSKVFGLTAGLPVNLEGLVGANGKVWGLESFGFSAPYKVLDEKLGFTGQNVYNQVKELLN